MNYNKAYANVINQVTGDMGMYRPGYAFDVFNPIIYIKWEQVEKALYSCKNLN